LTAENQRELGTPRHVVEAEINGILSADPAERAAQLDQLREAIVPSLAALDADDRRIGGTVRWAELPEASRPLIDALVAKQLVVKERRGADGGASNGRLGEVFVEIPQQSSLYEWRELDTWLRERRHNLITADDLLASAAAWSAGDHDASRLLSGTRLIDAEILSESAEFAERLAHTREYLKTARRTENAGLLAELERQRDEISSAWRQQIAADARAAEAHGQVLALGRRVRMLQAALVAAVTVFLVILIAVVASL
jgi:hypothetical protein